MKTHVKACFIIESEKKYLNKIDKTLEIKNNNISKKYHRHNGKALNSSLVFSTPYEESFDVSNQIGEIVDIVQDNIDKLKDFKTQNKCKYIFQVYIKIMENESTPAILLDKEVFEKLSEIDGVLVIEPYSFI